MYNWRGTELVTSSSTPARAKPVCTRCRKAGDSAGLVVVEARNGWLRIGLACQCGYSRNWSVQLEQNESLELDGVALTLDRFSHRPSKSPGGETSGELQE